MPLSDVDWAISYETNENQQQLLDTFYIPALEHSKKYFRVAGYFSSTALVVASEGIEALINNGGKMYLLVSPELNEDDLRIIKTHGQLDAGMNLFNSFDIPEEPEENLQALAFMLDQGLLEMKIVVPMRGDTSIFHQKIGIFFDKDSEEILSFSGSINETAQGWMNNIEEFKVFRSWNQGQNEYVIADLKKFIGYWKNEKPGIAQVYDVPEAVKQKIISVKPRDIHDLNIMKRYEKNRRFRNTGFKPFPHQQKAIEEWLANDCKLLMEMATGTGKTLTAIGCLLEKLKKKEKLVTIISTPQNTLSRQWKDEIEKKNIIVDEALIADGTNRKWIQELEKIFLKINSGQIDNAVVFTTHDTSSSIKFITIIRRSKLDVRVLFIADEVHAIATNVQKQALLPEYEYRIGLSATPERMFDDYGTQLIQNYFGNKSYKFTIYDALHTINPVTNKPFLNNYVYHPIFVQLNDEEYAKYRDKSRQIARELNKEEPDRDKLSRLADARADICKNAESKYEALSNLIEQIGPNSIWDTLLFVSDKQMGNCFDIIDDFKITRSKITENESASKIVNNEGESERQAIISQFKNHQLQMILSIKCLDEGIDIPNARTAILMSNGRNPREYIQRIGRVIRQSPGKKVSQIYDFIVYEPDDMKIIEKEAKRAEIIASNAVNYNEVIRMFGERGVSLNAN